MEENISLEDKVKDLEKRVQELENIEQKRKTKAIVTAVIKISVYVLLLIAAFFAFKYVKEEENLKKLRKLLNEKKVVNPIFMKGDFHPKRFLAMTKNYLSHFVKFKKYYS